MSSKVILVREIDRLKDRGRTSILGITTILSFSSYIDNILNSLDRGSEVRRKRISSSTSRLEINQVN